MEAIILLADAAQVADSKLYVLGGGWSVCGPSPAPSALAIKIVLTPSEFDIAHHWKLTLEDADGRPVKWASSVPNPVAVEGQFSVTADGPDFVPGTPVNVPLAVTLGPIELPPGQRFLWRLEIDSETVPGGVATFSTRPLA